MRDERDRVQVEVEECRCGHDRSSHYPEVEEGRSVRTACLCGGCSCRRYERKLRR